MVYHKVTYDDCLSVATKDEKNRLDFITDIDLLKILAGKWCDKNGYTLWYYLGNKYWDATKKEH